MEKVVRSKKNSLSFILKVVVGVGLFYYLYRQDKIDLQNIKAHLTNTRLAFFFIGLTFLQLFLASVRTYHLLQIPTSTKNIIPKIFAISWSSAFLECITPSSLFGELYRITKLMHVAPSLNKENPVYASVLSKLLTIVSLVLIAVCLSLFVETSHPLLKSYQFVLYSSLTLLMTIALLSRICSPLSLLKKLTTRFYHIKFFQKLVSNFEQYNNNLLRPRGLLSLTAITLLIQVLNILSLIIIIRELNPHVSLPTQDLFFVIPAAVFIMSIPISVSGFGTGHLALSHTLEIFNISNGADVFTIFLVFSYCFNLLGFAPFCLDFFRGGKLLSLESLKSS